MNRTQTLRRSKLALGLIAALAAAPVFAQSTSAGVGGQVTGADGQPVVGAEVVITHVDSGTFSAVTTDANGRYSARGLRVGGPYTVVVNKAGAGTDTENNVFLGLDQVTQVNAQLGGGGQQSLDTVTVVGTMGPVDFSTANKGMGTTVGQRDLQNTPTPNRSIQDVARLDPRVNVTDRARGEISALGQNSRMNNISVDAVGVNDPFGLEANGLPYVGTPISQDSIEEYSISTANYDVTNSRSIGANINAVTKSGTNKFGGSVYYSYTDAENLTGDNPSQFRGFVRDWTGGVTFSGPIVKDRLFFFVSAEQTKNIAPGPDFGPVGSGATTEVRNLTQGDIDRIIQIAKGYGLNPGSLDSSAIDTDSKRYLVKLDWNISADHRASFRFNKVREVEPILGGFSANGIALSSYWYALNRNNDNYVVNLYNDWSENFSTESSLSYTNYEVLRDGLLGDQPQIIINLGRAANGTYNNTNPYVDLGEEQFSHYNELGVKTWKAFTAATLFSGDHEFKFGFDYQSDDFYNLFGRTQFGAYTFNGLDNFASGNYRQFDLYRPAAGYTIGDVAAKWTLKQYGFFAQDTWQATDNLSLQYGFRYDLPKTDDKPFYNPRFETAFGFRNDTTIDGNGVFQPRFSFNYQLSDEAGRMAQLRGGLGLFQGNTLGVWLTNPYQNNGLTVSTFSVRNNADSPAVSGLYPFSPDPYNQNVPPASTSQMVVDTLAPDFKQPTVWKSSFGIDAELPWWGLVATMEWQGLRVKDGFFYRNLNIGTPTGVLPDGRFTYYSNPTGGTTGNRNRANANSAFGQAITVLDNTDKGWANFVTVGLKKPFANDWSWSMNYTIGRSTEVNAGTSSQASSNFRDNIFLNPNEEVSKTSNTSTRHRVNAGITWSKKLFGDYATTVSAYYDGHSGRPYTWTFGNDANGDSYFRDPIFIPAPGQVSFEAGTLQTVIDEFYAYIANEPELSRYQGQIAPLQGGESPWSNQLDLGFRQELPGFMAGHKGELRLDIYNFLNLLNKDWGVEERVGYPFTRTLANYAGVANGKYVYSLPTVVDANGVRHYNPQAREVYDAKAVSRWAGRITLKYSF